MVDARGRRHHRIEIAGGPVVGEIAGRVAAVRANEREIRVQRRLEDVGLAVDDPRLLPFGGQRAVGRRREEAADAGAAGADTLGERTLRHQLDLQLAAQELPLEFLVLADVGRNHLADLPRPQQNPDAEVVDAGVVADDRQVLVPRA